MKRTSRQMPQEQRAKISIALKGKKKSEITKQKISNSMKTYWSTIPQISHNENVETNKRQQRAMSQEIKNKISATLKGRPLTHEWRVKISNSMKTYWSTIPKVLN